MARFKVVSVTGWGITPDSKTKSGPPAVSFAVLDAAVCCRTVSEFNAGHGPEADRRAKADALARKLERAHA